MKRRTLIIVHVLFWVYTLFLMEIALQIAYGKPFSAVPNFFAPLAVSNHLIFFLIFYLNYLLILPVLLKQNRYLLTVVAWFLLCCLFVLLRYYIQEVLLYRYLGVCNYCEFEPYSYITVHFFQCLTWFLLPGTAIWLFDSKLGAERKNMALQQEKMNREKAFLQAQLNPHFVFNSLHTIYSMVFHKAEESLDAIKTFSDILRHALNPTRAELVPLQDELEYLKKYIALQEYRNRSETVKLEIVGNVDGYMIPPLLLITFVENAFKHGIYNDPLHPIRIHVSVDHGALSFTAMNKNTPVLHLRRRDQGVLSFTTMNKVNPNRAQNSTSIGLSSMRRILELTYGKNFELNIKEKDQYYLVSLVIKQMK